MSPEICHCYYSILMIVYCVFQSTASMLSALGSMGTAGAGSGDQEKVCLSSGCQAVVMTSHFDFVIKKLKLQKILEGSYHK